MRASKSHPGKVFTGQESLDGAHRAIMEMANQMTNAITDHDGLAAYERVLQEIMAHFAEEEALMAAYAYPFAKQHQRAHANFIEAVRYFRAHWDFAVGPSASLGRFIEDWWIRHIETIDKDLAEFTAGNEAPEDELDAVAH